MTAAAARLAVLPARRSAGGGMGIAAICCAHPVVLEATLRRAARTGEDVLLEATCNQVNHEGGYTGMTPAQFRDFVADIAGRVGFPPQHLILGGDHLGPNPWRHLSAAEAMARAGAMVAAYAAAGFAKIHLDASMACAGEGQPSDALVAARAAELAAVAEAHAPAPPVYVVGTEVPVPGGAVEALDHLAVTRPGDAVATVAIHRAAFAARGLEAAFERVIGVVVQPGVEFGNAEVVDYAPEKARGLVQALDRLPGLVFEAHSTDYQPPAALGELVRDGFAILKVGPWLTFALREALYGLAGVAEELVPDRGREPIRAVMERVMLAAPENWQRYYPGTPEEQRLQRHFSFSDRIRYYWPVPEAQAAVTGLMAALGDRPIPRPLVSQYLGGLEAMAPATAPALLRAAVTRVLDIYGAATTAVAKD